MRLHVINLIGFGLRSEWGYWGYQRCDKPNNIRDYVTESEIKEVKEIVKDKNNKVILHAIGGESWSSDAILNILSELEVTPDLEHVQLLVDANAIDWRPDNVLDFPVKYYKQNLMRIAFYDDQYPPNIETNTDTGKFLFFVGKPFKYHRIGLLYRLYKADLLKSCDWSFRINDAIYDKTRQCLPNVSDQEFDEFVKNTIRTLDDINIFLGPKGDRFEYEGHPYDTSLYANTSFSLISETMVKPNCLTEKTWRTISNRHPFIILGTDECFAWMNSINLDTFDYCREAKTTQGMLGQAVTSVEIMLNSINDFRVEVKASVENNYETFRKLVSDERVMYDTCLEKYLIPPFAIKPKIVEIIDGQDAVNAIDKLWC